MENWLSKNLKYITIILLVLFFIKFGQSCTRKMAIESNHKKYSYELDSITKLNKHTSDSLTNELLVRDFIIKDLSNELKIYNVMVSEAQKRADAIQSTAEKIKSHTTTTIEVTGVERTKDTTIKK